MTLEECSLAIESIPAWMPTVWKQCSLYAVLTFCNRAGSTPTPNQTPALLFSACSPGAYFPLYRFGVVLTPCYFRSEGKRTTLGLPVCMTWRDDSHMPVFYLGVAASRHAHWQTPSCPLSLWLLTIALERYESLWCSKRVIPLYVMHADVMWELPPHVMRTDVSYILYNCPVLLSESHDVQKKLFHACWRNGGVVPFTSCTPVPFLSDHLPLSWHVSCVRNWPVFSF